MSFGLICGTSLLDSNLFGDLSVQNVSTERRQVEVRKGDGFYVLQRHDSPEGYRAPHEIDHQSNILALEKLNVDQVMGIHSVGTLTNQIPPGTFAIPHDFLNLWQTYTFYPDRRGHSVAAFDNVLRKRIREALKQKNIGFSEEAVYVQTRGPRFETPAEGRLLAEFGDIVGMTAAAEVILASERDLPYASLCSIDNFVNGIEGTAVDYQSFQEQVKQHRSRVVYAVEGLLDEFRS